jgi:hypothetical protein
MEGVNTHVWSGNEVETIKERAMNSLLSAFAFYELDRLGGRLIGLVLFTDDSHQFSWKVLSSSHENLSILICHQSILTYFSAFKCC